MPLLLAEKVYEPWLSGEGGVELLKPAADGLLHQRQGAPPRRYDAGIQRGKVLSFPMSYMAFCADFWLGRLVSSTVSNFKQRCRKVCRCRR